MHRSEIIAGLKKGRVLMMDGAATEEERKLIRELQLKGQVEVKPVHSDRESQYTAYEIKWIQAKK